MAPTARVADSYGPDPHEHKPSQDPFLPDVDQKLTEAKQAATGGADVDDETAERAVESYPEESEWDGSSSSTSESSSESSPEKTVSDDPKPAPTTESRTAPAPKGGSSVASTATGRSVSSKGK